MISQVIIGLGISYLLLFILSIIIKDNSIADIFWGLGFLQVCIHSFILSGTWELSQMLLGALIIAWSFRISIYIFSKKILKPGEDNRYAGWRRTWKYFYLRSFFQVYIFQGFLLLIIAAPIMLINFFTPVISSWTIIGSFIALAGLIFETVADLQLRSFIKKGTGKIMTTGLWHYSRHPNYFGESVFWLGITIMALPVAWYAAVSWLLITFLLRFVSGVPLAEKRYAHRKDFRTYQQTTPAMFPNFFKK